MADSFKKFKQTIADQQATIAWQSKMLDSLSNVVGVYASTIEDLRERLREMHERLEQSEKNFTMLQHGGSTPTPRAQVQPQTAAALFCEEEARVLNPNNPNTLVYTFEDYGGHNRTVFISRKAVEASGGYIQCIKNVREQTGLGLKEAKDCVDTHFPRMVSKYNLRGFDSR